MYTEIGFGSAKARLTELLEEVRRGHRYTITLKGYPIADLVPSESSTISRDALAAVEMMRNIRKVRGVCAETIGEWVAEGRR